MSELSFTIGEAAIGVVLANLVEPFESGRMEKGIRLSLTIPAPSLNDAVRLAEVASSLVSPLVAVATAAEVATAAVELVYEDTPDSESGELLRLDSAELPELTLRKLYLHHLEPLFVGLATAAQNDRDRVLRALSWYQRALSQRDVINRFTMLWTALEALDPLLAVKWNLSAPIRECPKCGTNLGKHAGLVALRDLFQRIPEHTSDGFRRARRLRNDAIHGARHTNEMAVEATALMQMLEAAVPRAIARLFDLSSTTEDSLARNALPALPKARMSAWLEFERVPNSELGLDPFYPHLLIDLQTRINWNHLGYPASADFQAHLSLVAAASVRPRKVNVTARLRTGEIPVLPAKLEQVLAAPPIPEHNSSEVLLWEKPASVVWRPKGSAR